MMTIAVLCDCLICLSTNCKKIDRKREDNLRNYFLQCVRPVLIEIASYETIWLPF